MRTRGSNTVRVIGGQFRGRILRFPDLPGLRPTPDRVRETLFNWLGQRLDGLTCLDAFAGSGALGFEAVSRGAARVIMLERDAAAHAALRGNAERLAAGRVEIARVDAIAYLRSPGESFDLIFLDPPFDSGLLPEALRCAATRLRPGGKIYAEAAAFPCVEGLSATHQGRAGHAHYCLLEPV